MSIRVVIADNERLVRTGLRLILKADGEIEVVAEAENGHHAVEVVLNVLPDVVLMDIRMPVVDGLEATRRILASDHAPRVIVITTLRLGRVRV